MKTYKWLTPNGYYDSFSKLSRVENLGWFQAIERKDSLEPTIVKYVCSSCGYNVIGIILIDYTNPMINKKTYPDLNDQMMHKLDFFPESYMLSQTFITNKEIELFDCEFDDSYRDIGLHSINDVDIYNMFKNDQIIINRPIIDLIS